MKGLSGRSGSAVRTSVAEDEQIFCRYMAEGESQAARSRSVKGKGRVPLQNFFHRLLCGQRKIWKECLAWLRALPRIYRTQLVD